MCHRAVVVDNMTKLNDMNQSSDEPQIVIADNIAKRNDIEHPSVKYNQ